MDHDSRIAGIFKRHRRDSVLLQRPYPPYDAPRVNSKFGGLPTLPADHDWPRAASGIPLHFLAQIDCAEIPFKTALPDRGMLFFFGQDDEEQIWDDEENAGATCVIYLPAGHPTMTRRAVPDDLPPIRGDYPPYHRAPFLRAGQPGPNVHIEWPIRMLRMDSWPDLSALSDDDINLRPDWKARLRSAFGQRASLPPITGDEFTSFIMAYDKALEAKREAAFSQTTSTRKTEKTGSIYDQVAQTSLQILGEDNAPNAYPNQWIFIDYFCGALRTMLSGRNPERVLPRPDVALTLAENWLARADAAGPGTAVAAADRTEFRAWIASMRDPDDSDRRSFYAADCIIRSAQAVIRDFAGNRVSARSISDNIYAALAADFQGYCFLSGVRFSQMLGHAPSAQQALMTTDREICLLNLASDDGLGWKFGDVGNARFEILPEALAQRDFSGVQASVTGG